MKGRGIDEEKETLEEKREKKRDRREKQQRKETKVDATTHEPGLTYLISERWLQASGGLVRVRQTLSCSTNR